MKSSLILILSIFLLFLGPQKEETPTENMVPEGKMRVSITKPDAEKVELLNMLGQKYIHDIEIIAHTKNDHYLFFSAITKKRTSNDSIIESIKLTSSFVHFPITYDEKKKSFKKEVPVYQTMNYQMLFDQKTPQILQNDSIYFSLCSGKLQTMGIPGRLSQFKHLFCANDIYEDSEIIPICAGLISPKTNQFKENNKEQEGLLKTSNDFPFLIGMISYDYEKTDLRTLFESKEFARYVQIAYMGHPVGERWTFDIHDLKTKLVKIIPGVESLRQN